MKFDFLRKQTSRREMLRGSATLAGSAVLAHLFHARLLRASVAGYPQQAPSDVLAAMRDWFNAFPLETKRLSEDVTMLFGPGGSVVVLNGPDGKFVVDGEAIRRSRPRLGQRRRQRRPVGPNRLFGPLSLRLSIFPTSYPSNEFAKRSDKNE